jgi:gluconolactonase
MLVLPLAAYAASGCSKKSSDDEETAGENGGGGGENGGGGGGGENGTGPTSPGDVPKEDLAKNPIENIAAPKAVFTAGAYTDGPVWHQKLGVLFFSTPLGEGALYRMLPDGRVMKVRDGVRAEGSTPVGNTINAAGEIVTAEVKRITRTAFDEKNAPLAPVVIATGYDPNGQPVPGPESTSKPGVFDTLNDVVAKKDGTLFVTDPGFFENANANRIFRIAPDGAVQVVEAFEDVPRPNGIALSPDEKFLYVGFSTPIQGTLPFIRQYTVNPDGTLGEWTKFVDIGPDADSKPDGIAVDLAGNVYVATKVGVEVFKPDSTKIGEVPMEEKPTGLCFGGKDMKSLYVTTEGVKVWELRVNVPGISQ